MDKKEAAKQKFNERTASKRFKLPEGDTTFRVMPNARGMEKAEYIEYRMHSNVGARKAYLRCGHNIRGEGDCWLCDVQIPKLEKSGKSSHKAAAEALKSKECFAVQIIYQVDGKWVGPTLWEMSAGVANKLLNVMSRRDVSHPEKGYNLTISRKGTTLTSTKYGDIDRDDEKSEVPEKLLEKLKPFGEVLRKYDEEVMKAEYYGHEQDEPEEEETTKKGHEEEEEEEKPKSKKPRHEEEPEPEAEEEEEEKPKAKKKPKPDAEEEGEEAEQEEEIPNLEEEEEERPKSKKKPKDEEEEENEPEAEEEEEKPKAKKKPREEPEEEEEEPKPKKKAKPSSHEEDNE